MRKFSTSLRGYDKEEVNDFISNIANNYEEMLNSLKERDQKIITLTEKMKSYQDLEQSLNKAILVAEDASVQIKKLARDEAELVIQDARKNASRIINNALLKAEKAENDADNLRRKISVYKRRIKQVLEEQLEYIEDIEEM